MRLLRELQVRQGACGRVHERDDVGHLRLARPAARHAPVQVHDDRHNAEPVAVAVDLSPPAIVAASNPHGLIRQVQRDVGRSDAGRGGPVEACGGRDDLAATVDLGHHLPRRLDPHKRQRPVCLIRAHRHESPAVDHPVTVEHRQVRLEVVRVPDGPQRRVRGLLARQDQRPNLLAVVDRVHDRAAPVRDDEEPAHRRRDRHAQLLDTLAPLVVAEQQLVVHRARVKIPLESVDGLHFGGGERHRVPPFGISAASGSRWRRPSQASRRRAHRRLPHGTGRT